MPEQLQRRSLAGLDILLAEAGDLDQTGLAALLLAGLGLDAPAFRLEHDGLGRPWPADAEGAPLPALLSCSRLGGRLWAAAARAEQAAGLGLDLAAPGDFGPPYPVARAFAPEELAAAHTLRLGGAEVLALLWSLKEAGAKALGTGFHRLEPLDLRARAFRRTPQGLACALDVRETILPALAERRPEGWLALAVLNADGAVT